MTVIVLRKIVWRIQNEQIDELFGQLLRDVKYISPDDFSLNILYANGMLNAKNLSR